MVGPVIDAKIGLIQMVRKVRGIVIFFLGGQNRNCRKVRELKLLLNQLCFFIPGLLNFKFLDLSPYKL